MLQYVYDSIQEDFMLMMGLDLQLLTNNSVQCLTNIEVDKSKQPQVNFSDVFAWENRDKKLCTLELQSNVRVCRSFGRLLY